jgi:sugar phosphate isomerase/epimerase
LTVKVRSLGANTIAVMSYSFASLVERGELTTTSVARLLPPLGVPAIEIMDRHLADDEDGALRAALDELDLAVAAYDLTCELVTTDRARRKAAIARARAGLERAAGLGARHVMVVPGHLEPGMDPDVARDLVAEGLRQCLDEAARLGLALSIENLGYQAALCGRVEHVESICAAVGPALGVTFDAGNFLFAFEDPVAALRQLGPRVMHVHLKDWLSTAGGYVGAPLGAGVVDLQSVVSELRTLGYSGYLSVEYEGPGDPRAAVARGVDWLKSQG